MADACGSPDFQTVPAPEFSWIRSTLAAGFLALITSVGHANPVESSIDQLLLIRKLITNPGTFEFNLADRTILKSLVSDVFATMDTRQIFDGTRGQEKRWLITLSAERFKTGHPALWEDLTGDFRSGIDYARFSIHRAIAESTTLGIVHAGSDRRNLVLNRIELRHHLGAIQAIDLRCHAGLGFMEINRVGHAFSGDAGIQIGHRGESLSPYAGVLYGQSTMYFSKSGIEDLSLQRVRWTLGSIARITDSQHFGVEAGFYNSGQRYVSTNYTVYF